MTRIARERRHIVVIVQHKGLFLAKDSKQMGVSRRAVQAILTKQKSNGQHSGPQTPWLAKERKDTFMLTSLWNQMKQHKPLEPGFTHLLFRKVQPWVVFMGQLWPKSYTFEVETGSRVQKNGSRCSELKSKNLKYLTVAVCSAKGWRKLQSWVSASNNEGCWKFLMQQVRCCISANNR